MEQLQTVIRYLKENKTSTFFWLMTILMWIFFLLGFTKTGNWNLISAGVIFCLIMIIGSLKDKVKDLQEKLDKFKI